MLEKMSSVESMSTGIGREKEQNMTQENPPATHYVAADPKKGGKSWSRIWKRGHPIRIVASIPKNRLQQTWQQRLSMFMVKLLWSSYTLLKFVGFVFEWTTNFFVLNGGVFKLLWKLLLVRWGEIVIPNPDADNYLSCVGQLDPRSGLYITTPGVTKHDGFKKAEVASLHENVGSRLAADFCIMAAKLSYENPAVVKRQVEENWQMHFVKFYNCWNEYQQMNNTQAFVVMDKPKDANVVVVAFRGTEAFNSYDWSTDIDFSWVKLDGLGGVHLGFLEALGLVTREDLSTATTLRNNATKGRKAQKESRNQRSKKNTAASSGLANRIIDDRAKKLAYDEITQKVTSILQANPRAKLFITGHSLGGALSTLYATMLHYTGQTEVASRIAAVYTFGQPRVGDDDFVSYGMEKLKGKYFRVVYCNDVVPRLPFDNQLFAYRHFGPCVYFNSVYDGLTLRDQPNPNFFGVARLLTMHLNALWEIFQGLIFITLQHGQEYSESASCLLFRALGLLFPGVSSHSPCNYVNAVRLGPFPLQERLKGDHADISQEIYIMQDNVKDIFSAVTSEMIKALGFTTGSQKVA